MFLEALGLARAIRADTGGETWSAADDRWYTPLLAMLSGAGQRVGPDTAMRQVTVYQCVNALSGDTGSLPFPLYRRTDDGGKERATDHPLYRILHDQPNPAHTTQQWLQTSMASTLLYGFGPNEILRRGASGPPIGLRPLPAMLTTPEMLPNGRRRYQVRDAKTGKVRPLSQDEVFTIPGLSLDGVTWLTPVGYMRELLGIAMAQDNFSATFYRNFGIPTSGVVEMDKTFADATDRENFRKDLMAWVSGGNRHKILPLELGMKYKDVAMKHTDAQFLEDKKYTKRDILGIYGVPPHRVGDLAEAHFNNVESLGLQYVIYSLRRWLVAIEQQVRFSLLTEEERDEYFAEFLVDALLRGDIASRYTAYQKGILAGFLTRNEVRGYENLNPLPGLSEPLTPQNMALGADPGNGGGADNEERPPNAGKARARYSAVARIFARDAAIRSLNREKAALVTAAKRHASSPNGFAEAVAKHYAEHTGYLMETLHMPEAMARKYCTDQQRTVLANGVPALERWGDEHIEHLTQLALEAA